MATELVDLAAFTAQFPRPLDAAEEARTAHLLILAEQEVRAEFGEAGRDLDSEIAARPWLAVRARRVITELVSVALHVGANAGLRSAQSSTGAESDAVTFAGDGAPWVSMSLTDAHRAALGLPSGAGPRWSFPKGADCVW